MKKILIFSFILLPFFLFPQGKLDNEFYFRGGFSLPFWSQYGGTQADWGDGFKRIGFTGELGTIFMIAKFPETEHMAVGIDVDYLTFYWHKFSNDQPNNVVDLWNFRLGSKIGPSFSFSPVKRLAFDVYVKLDACWLTATAIMEDNDEDDMEGFGQTVVFGISSGFNVRFSILMVGFEFNTINPKLENVDNEGEFLGNINDPNSDKSPLPSFNFMVGLSF